MPFTTDLARAVFGRTISSLGDGATIIALTLALAGRGPWAVSALLVAGFAPVVVMAPFAGGLVDRRDSRQLLVTAGVLQTVLSGALAFTTNLPAVLALLFCLGACQAVIGSTWTSLVPGIVGPERMSSAVGTLQAWGNAALIGGPAVGGLLVGLGGVRTALLLDTATFALATLAGASVRHRRHVEQSAQGTRFRDGLDALRRDRVLATLVAMLTLFILLGGAANVADVFLVRETLHAGAAWYGAVSAGFGAAMVLGSVAASRVRDGQHGRGAVFAMVLLGAYLLGSATAPSVGWLLAWSVLGGLANALLNLCVSTLLALRVPEEVRGRVGATVSGLASAAMMVAMLSGGLLTSLLSPREVFALCGAVGLLAPVLLGRRLLVVPASPEASRAEHAPVG